MRFQLGTPSLNFNLGWKSPYNHPLNQFNNATLENNNYPENIFSSKYYDIDQIYNAEIPNKNKSLPLFHINACFLYKKTDDLQHLLSCTEINFDTMEVTETRIPK